MNIKHIDHEKFPPTKSTCYGKAWKQDMTEVLKLQGTTPHSGLAGWTVFCPWAHPLWSYYAMQVIHLRDVPGLPPAKITLEGATHEIFLMALDPMHEPDLVVIQKTALRPLNFSGQFIAESDDAAIAKMEQSVEDILAGILNPDTDHIRQWVNRYSGSNLLH